MTETFQVATAMLPGKYSRKQARVTPRKVQVCDAIGMMAPRTGCPCVVRVWLAASAIFHREGRRSLRVAVS